MGDIAVLVADAQRLFGECLGVMLSREAGVRVVPEHPTTAPATVEASTRHRPDVVLVDYWIPGPSSGPAVIRELLAAEPGPRVLALSWVHSPEDAQAAVVAGAAGFLPKSISVAQTVDAVRRADGGDPLVYGEQLAALLDDIAERHEQAEERWRRLQSLTPRELEVLALLAEGRPLADLAPELDMAVGSLKTRVHGILRKLGVKNQLEAVAMARRERLLDVPAPPGTSAAVPQGRHYWTR